MDEYIALFEIGEDGYCSRYLEIRQVGHMLKYTEEKPADEFGALPEGPWDALEAAKAKYGTLTAISKPLFDNTWNSIGPVDCPFRVGR